MQDLVTLLNTVDENAIAFFLKGLEGGYRYINEPGARMIGRTAAQIIGASDYELFAKSSADLMRARDLQIIADGRVCEYRSVAQTALGWKLFHSVKVPMVGKLPGLDGIIGISADVTAETNSSCENLIVIAGQLMESRPDELFDVISSRRMKVSFARPKSILNQIS